MRVGGALSLGVEATEKYVFCLNEAYESCIVLGCEVESD